MRVHRIAALRRLVIPILAKFGNIDLTIRHHYTGGKLYLNLFTHKAYWFCGKHRAGAAMRSLARVVRPGDVVLDVGGHIGYVALYLAHLVGDCGKVFVFEPGVNNLFYTRKNLSRISNAALIQKAVSDH